MRSIKKGAPDRPSACNRMTDPWWNILVQCWEVIPSSRPNISQVVEIVAALVRTFILAQIPSTSYGRRVVRAPLALRMCSISCVCWPLLIFIFHCLSWHFKGAVPSPALEELIKRISQKSPDINRFDGQIYKDDSSPKRGTYAIVYRGTQLPGQTKVAVKTAHQWGPSMDETIIEVSVLEMVSASAMFILISG